MRITYVKGVPGDELVRVRDVERLVGGVGVVTSVGVSGSDGIEVDSGSPVTGAGSIALGVNAGTLRAHINVADGATANATNADLRDRATHTGTQLAATVSDFATAVAGTASVTANTAKVSNATHSGDATGDTVLTIANDVVSNAKLADMAANTVKVRAANSSGDPSDVALAASQLLGRGATGDVAPIVLGTNLSMTGAVLNAKAIVVNVRDFGAVGDGATDDRASIKSAMQTLTDNSCLYFPAGVYLISSWLTFDTAHDIVSVFLHRVAIRGDGMGASIIRCQRTGTNLKGGVVINIPKECTYFDLSNLTLDSNCIARVPGQSCLAIGSDNSSLQKVELVNSGQFTIAGGRYDGNYMKNFSVVNCVIRNGYADGINFNKVEGGVIADNIVDKADDDCIALGVCRNIVVTGNHCRGRLDVSTQVPVVSITRSGATATVTYLENNFYTVGTPSVTIAGADQADYNGTFTLTPTGTGPGYTTGTYPVGGAPASPATGTITIVAVTNGGLTTWGRGIWATGGYNNVIANNAVYDIKQNGIYLNEEGDGRCTGFLVANNLVKNASIESGHGIEITETTNCTLEGNVVIDPVGGSCIDIADWQGLTIKGGLLYQSVDRQGRGIHASEDSGYAASWTNLRINDVAITLAGASNSECVYLRPHSSVTMNTLIVSSVVGKQATTGDYIWVESARTGTLAKLVNNVDMTGSRTITPASGGVFTTTNNN